MLRVGRGLFHHFVEVRLRDVAHHLAQADAGFIGRNLHAVEPCAVGEAKEIVTRMGGAIFAGKIETPRTVNRFRRAGGSAATCHD